MARSSRSVSYRTVRELHDALHHLRQRFDIWSVTIRPLASIEGSRVCGIAGESCVVGSTGISDRILKAGRESQAENESRSISRLLHGTVYPWEICASTESWQRCHTAFRECCRSCRLYRASTWDRWEDGVGAEGRQANVGCTSWAHLLQVRYLGPPWPPSVASHWMLGVLFLRERAVIWTDGKELSFSLTQAPCLSKSLLFHIERLCLPSPRASQILRRIVLSIGLSASVPVNMHFNTLPRAARYGGWASLKAKSTPAWLGLQILKPTVGIFGAIGHDF